MKNLLISYLGDGHRFITDGDIWIICHPEDGEVVASWSENELFDDDIIREAMASAAPLTEDQLTPGLVDSINNVWE